MTIASDQSFISEKPGIQIPSSSSSLRPKSVILEEIHEVLQQILMEQINTVSGEEGNTAL